MWFQFCDFLGDTYTTSEEPNEDCGCVSSGYGESRCDRDNNFTEDECKEFPEEYNCEWKCRSGNMTWNYKYMKSILIICNFCNSLSDFVSKNLTVIFQAIWFKIGPKARDPRFAGLPPCTRCFHNYPLILFSHAALFVEQTIRK